MGTKTAKEGQKELLTMGCWSLQLQLVSYILCAVILRCCDAAETKRDILVFGGNGFLGASAVEKFIENGDNVTMINRGNLYWDSQSRILPHVNHIKCDRKMKLDECPHLIEFVNDNSYFEAVVDFSAYRGHEVKEAAGLLKDKVGLYIMISTDSVYDVCEKKHDGPSKETDSVRPESKDEQNRLSIYHTYGHNKLEAEEELLNQRIEGGFPFVILRLPDVIGPRDTTYRIWIYQLWTKLTQEITEKPVKIPYFLLDYGISFVYSEDIARTIKELLSMGPQIKDQVINLAYPETLTIKELLDNLKEALEISNETFEFMDPENRNSHEHVYFYPTVRRGPLDTTKAASLLSWKPTPWKDMIKETVEFYEKAMVNEVFHQQRDEIIQVVGQQVYKDDLSKLYDAIEKVYDINLPHFKQVKDEL